MKIILELLYIAYLILMLVIALRCMYLEFKVGVYERRFDLCEHD